MDRQAKQHHKLIPHRHVANRVELTSEMTFADFVAIVTAEDKA